MAWAILGVAVQGQVGDHEPVALGEPLDDRLPLAMGQQPAVKQREWRTGADLAVGDAGTVVVVVEAKPHRGCLARGHDPHRMEDRRCTPLGECIKLWRDRARRLARRRPVPSGA